MDEAVESAESYEGLGELSSDVIAEFGEVETTPAEDAGNDDTVATVEAEPEADDSDDQAIEPEVQEAIDAIEYQEMAEAIANGEHYEAFTEAVEHLPEEILDAINGNPVHLKSLYDDIVSGEFSRVIGKAQGLIDSGKSFNEAFMLTTKALKAREDQQVRAEQKRSLLTSEPRAVAPTMDKKPQDMGMNELDDYIELLNKK